MVLYDKIKVFNAFITKRGNGNQANYHWFFFNQPKEVCTKEWVHPNVPNEQYDF